MSEPNLDWTQIVAERKIQEGIEAGDFDNVPGMGEPVDLNVDPFTPVHLRLANKILKNARALPEWLQLEKDIQRERNGIGVNRERGLNAIRSARSAPSRERAIHKLRVEHRERLSTVNTMILKYCFAAPISMQQPFAPYNVRGEMVALEDAIANASTVTPQEMTSAAPKKRRRSW